MNGGRRYDPWRDAYGVRIAAAARVEQVDVHKGRGALPGRLGKLGVVTEFRQTRVAVRFDGEAEPVTLRPYLLRVIEQAGDDMTKDDQTRGGGS